MVRTKLTTAKHRSLAWDFEHSKDYLNAYKHTSLAIHNYPGFPKGSQMAEHDILSMKKQMKMFKKMI